MMATFFFILLSVFLSAQGIPQVYGPLSDDFSRWLDKHGYSKWRTQFERNDMGKFGSYGGRTHPGQKIHNNPVVFIHGNSDQALDSGKRHGLTGWTQSIDYFMSKNYSSAELYATTWGPADLALASDQVHTCAYLTGLRKFTEAVIAYTGASKIDMISHSMGVTLARKVAQGGLHTDESGEDCDIGDPLTDSIDTFVGICGGDRGLALCFTPPGDLVKACNAFNGFYPGFCLTGDCEGDVPGVSKYLAKLNAQPHRREGQHIYTIWSRGDEVIGFEDLVWGQPTSKIPGQDGEKVYLTHGHIACKDKTGAEQFAMVTKHVVI